jgi:hypothetical protein
VVYESLLQSVRFEERFKREAHQRDYKSLSNNHRPPSRLYPVSVFLRRLLKIASGVPPRMRSRATRFPLP